GACKCLNDLETGVVDSRTASGVSQPREPQAVQFANEMAGRVHLMFGWQLRLLADGGVKNAGVGTRDEETRGVAVPVALDFTRRWIGSVFGVADRKSVV